MDHNIMQIQRAAAQQPPSPYHVYPLANNPIQQAFQVQCSPISVTKRQQLLEMTNHMTPTMRHTARIQETSFTNDSEEQIMKINAMFPTVSEYHIRMLMKKYYNREAVVISKLQVEKYPLTTPGPQTPQLSIKYPSICQYQMTPRGSPIPPRPSSSLSGVSYSPAGTRVGYSAGFSPKPHSSPKMKLRYMKSLFPQAEETLILDILAGVDNNVQKTSDKLKVLGYEKREPRRRKDPEDEQKKDEVITVIKVRAKTNEEKLKLKSKLQGIYQDIPEKIILMALDSVNYDEGRAIQILNIVVDDNEMKNNLKAKTDADENDDASSRGNSLKSRHSSETTTASVQFFKPLHHAEPECYLNDNKNEIQKVDETISPEGGITKKERQSRPKIKNDHSKTSHQEKEKTGNDTVNVVSKSKCFKSIVQRPNALGPNSQFRKGHNEDLLLADYCTWNGNNPNLVRGPNKDICKGRKNNAIGPAIDSYKGPQTLAKGSIYQNIQLVCN